MLKVLGHRLSSQRHGYVSLQQTILGEKALEESIFDLRQRARSVFCSRPGGGDRRFIGEGSGPRFLFMCFGDPSSRVSFGGASRVVAGVCAAHGVGAVDVCDGRYLFDGGGAGSDASNDGEQLVCEGKCDPISVGELQERKDIFDDQVASLYWAMRKAVRRYSVANDKFGPRTFYNGSRFRRSFRKGSGNGKRRGEVLRWECVRLIGRRPGRAFVSFSKGRSSGSRTFRVNCFDCGKPEHFATYCFSRGVF